MDTALRYVAQLAASGAGLSQHAALGPVPAPWDHLADIALAHGVLSHFWCGAEIQDVLAPEGRQACQQRMLSQARRVLLTRAEWRCLAQLLDRAEIAWLAIKGIGLSCQLYGDTLSRGSGDLDLWVPPAQAAAADRALTEAGYRRLSPPSASAIHSRWHTRTNHEFGGYLSPRGSWVEVHIRWHPVPELSTPSWQACYEGRVQLPIWQEQSIAVPSLAAHYQGVLIHGARSRWRRLKWLFDALRSRQLLGTEAHSIERALFKGRPARHVDQLQKALLSPHDSDTRRPLASKHLRSLPDSALESQSRHWWHHRLADLGREWLWAHSWRARRSVLLTRLALPTPYEQELLGERSLWVYWLARPYALLRWWLSKNEGPSHASFAQIQEQPQEAPAGVGGSTVQAPSDRPTEAYTVPSWLEAERVGHSLLIRDDRLGSYWLLNATAAALWQSLRWSSGTGAQSLAVHPEAWVSGGEFAESNRQQALTKLADAGLIQAGRPTTDIQRQPLIKKAPP